MDDILAARSQMAMSLAFYIIFAAVGILLPSYYYLFRVFKSKTAFTAFSEKSKNP